MASDTKEQYLSNAILLVLGFVVGQALTALGVPDFVFIVLLGVGLGLIIVALVMP
jgi:hypothetical protein